MATDPNTLANDARCFDCIINQGMFSAVAIYILDQIKNGVAVSTDPNTLANEARCYDCVIPDGEKSAVIIKELLDLNTAIAGGSFKQVYEGQDPLPPTDPTKPALNYPSGGGTLTQWDVVSQTWV